MLRLETHGARRRGERPPGCAGNCLFNNDLMLVCCCWPARRGACLLTGSSRQEAAAARILPGWSQYKPEMADAGRRTTRRSVRSAQRPSRIRCHIPDITLCSDRTGAVVRHTFRQGHPGGDAGPQSHGSRRGSACEMAGPPKKGSQHGARRAPRSTATRRPPAPSRLPSVKRANVAHPARGAGAASQSQYEVTPYDKGTPPVRAVRKAGGLHGGDSPATEGAIAGAGAPVNPTCQRRQS
jgi:hypothetical protein